MPCSSECATLLQVRKTREACPILAGTGGEET